jgi:hypothetical protein
LVFAPVLAASPAEEGGKVAVGAVFSHVARDYQRKTTSDGSIQPESFVFSFGGQVKRTSSDETIDRVHAGDFVELLRKHLAAQNYVLVDDVKSADLLLRVNWGRTVSSTGDLNQSVATNQTATALTAMSKFAELGKDGYVSQEERSAAADATAELESAMIMVMAEKHWQNTAIEFNAGLLGYGAEMNKWIGSPALMSAAGNRLDDLRGDVEEPRYYILVFAFDRLSVTEEHKPRLRWATRISIRAPGNRFDKNLNAMVAQAAHYFGRDSGGLIRRNQGTVELGETKVIGVVDESVEHPPVKTESEKRDGEASP